MIVRDNARISYVAQYSETQELLRRSDIETWTVCADAGLIDVTDGGWRSSSTPWSSQLLDMLWRSELDAIASRHRVVVPKRASHAVLRNACEEVMTGREVARPAVLPP